MDNNGVSPVPSSLSHGTQLSQMEQLQAAVKRDSGGGLLAQLSNNAFFTAVSLRWVLLGLANHYRASDWRHSVLQPP